jgi:tRNA threonylcarbamoyladenosine biosynthesis protein TsaE
MNNTIHIEKINNIETGARNFIQLMREDKIFAFYGDMGVGKTTFIKSVCKLLGVTQIVNSPTFSIINEYETSDLKIIYHFDCYRINKITEAIDMGVEEYFTSGNICFIEWPEKIEAILPDSIVKVLITEMNDQSRIIELIKKVKNLPA